MSDPISFDVVIIGAGMGGLLAGCQLAQAGKRVLLVEKLSFLGGRFSGFKVDNVEIPTGAFHTIPHGDKGPFSQALRRSGVNIQISNSKTFASFYINGEHIIAHNAIEILKIFSTLKEKNSVVRGLFLSWLIKDYRGSYGDWLGEIGMSENVKAVYDRFCQFTLSTTIYNLPYVEGRKVTEMIFKYGVPGVPKGGAREVSHQLGLAARNSGVEIRKNTRVQNLILTDGRVSGAVLFDRRLKETYQVKTSEIISSAGPGSTTEMLTASGLSPQYIESVFPTSPPPAMGFKLQVLSPRSLIQEDSIMFCLDTQRIAGILQASNLDPDLVPPGKHLLISHQIMNQGADWREERQLALEDWRHLFGTDFEDCEVLGSSNFPARFPVNWASQGYDLKEQVFAGEGVWMVGDGLKPSGLMMVEGVAASAETVVRQILGDINITPWEIPQILVWSRRLNHRVRIIFRGLFKKDSSHSPGAK